jgi:FkbM family methyltransferase
MPRVIRGLRRLAGELRLIRAAFANWPVVALAGLLWKHLPLPRHELVVKSRGGARFAVPLFHDAGALYPALEIFAFSAYDIGWQLEDRPYVIDIGANVGAFTLWLAERAPGLRGSCHEPDPDAFSYMERNVAGLDVAARREAVAASSGTAVLFRPSPAGGTSSLLPPAGPVPAQTVEVPTVSFDEVMADVDHAVALLKLDCEGSEYDIVLGSRPESWRLVQRVVIEYHPVADVDSAALAERLRELGFALLRDRQVGRGLGIYWFSRDD